MPWPQYDFEGIRFKAEIMSTIDAADMIYLPITMILISTADCSWRIFSLNYFLTIYLC